MVRIVGLPSGGRIMLIKDKKDLFTIPNLLSLFRLILIPVYMVIYLNAVVLTDYFIAAGILAVSCLTDAIDGHIARHFNMISTVGKVLDPLADKATQFALIVCLAVRHPLIWILVGLFVVKELFQLVAAVVALRKGKMLTGALFAGKICTTILFISLILMVMLPLLDEMVITVITVIDCIAVLISFIAYIRVYVVKNPMIVDIETGKNE